MIREKKKKIQKEHKYKNVEHETYIAVWSKETVELMSQIPLHVSVCLKAKLNKFAGWE